MPTPDLAATVATLLAALAAIGALLVGGVFFAFSSFVMKALARVPPPAGIGAMQAINVVVLNPGFLGVFLGTAPVAIAAALFAWPGPGRAVTVVGALLYVVGTVGVTVRCNVPRNDALATLDAAAPASATAWHRYVVTWTRWNHVRTAAAAAAGACFLAALATPA
jgi:uncharacterized membrane protein